MRSYSVRSLQIKRSNRQQQQIVPYNGSNNVILITPRAAYNNMSGFLVRWYRCLFHDPASRRRTRLTLDARTYFGKYLPQGKGSECLKLGVVDDFVCFYDMVWNPSELSESVSPTCANMLRLICPRASRMDFMLGCCAQVCAQAGCKQFEEKLSRSALGHLSGFDGLRMCRHAPLGVWASSICS